MNNDRKPLHNFLPAFIIGLTEGLIIVLSIFSFLFARGLEQAPIFLYVSIAAVLVAVLLALSAYYTREEEFHASQAESKTIKIYQSLDIDGALKDSMIEDTKNEKMEWESAWNDSGNATVNISSSYYALSIFTGFMISGAFVLANNFILEFPDYTALAIPVLLLGVLGYFKFKLTNRNPYTGMCLIAFSGLAAAIGAYFAGSFF